MKIFYQHGINENGICALKSLLSEIKIQVTDKSILKILDSPDYPALQSLSDSLKEWNCDNLGVKLNASQLSEIPYPAIAHLSKNNGHFVVLTEFVNGNLKYIDPEIGIVTEPVSEFEKKWTGVALLVQPNEKSGEEGYTVKRRLEIIEQVKKISAFGLVILIVLATGFLDSVSLPLLILKIIGGGLCFLLLQEQFGNTKYSKAICHVGKNTDCGAVIHSPASMAFGVIHLSELGLLYFFGGLVSLSISAIASHPILGVLTIFNSLALPYTFFSVYYQWRVIKKWCPLCLMVMVVFWLEFFSLNYNFHWPIISQPSIFIVLLGFSVPLLFWLAARQLIIDSFQLPNLERKLNHFLKNERIFQPLLEAQPVVSRGHLAHSIVAGSKNPQVELTIVSSPTCGPCAATHFAVESLLSNFSDKISVTYIFLVPAKEDHSISTKVAKHVIAMSLRKPVEEATKALSNWYLGKDKDNVEKWTEIHPVESEPAKEWIDSILSEQVNWCLEAGVNATPTIFINNKKMPEEFSANDLKFQLRKLIEKSEATVLELVS